MKKIISILIIMLCSLFLLSGCGKLKQDETKKVSMDFDNLKTEITRLTDYTFISSELPFNTFDSNDQLRTLFMTNKEDNNQFVIIMLNPTQQQIDFITDYAKVCVSRNKTLSLDFKTQTIDNCTYLVLTSSYNDSIEDLIISYINISS